MPKKAPIKAIHPIHHSLYPRGVRIPYDMQRVAVPRDTGKALTQVALDIFADCTNVGVPFQTALLAIYLSGLQHGSVINAGDTCDPRPDI